MILNRIKDYLIESCSYTEGQRVLVALSGGADSMMLVHVLKNIGVQVQAAHCNFNLRDAESDGDEEFVRNQMAEWDIKLHVQSFPTKQYAAEKGISIEMAARELRYGWFDQLMKQNGLDWIATGHHKDDSVETFFLNLLRGTGVKGLSGIKPVSGKVIRPLLSLSRADIEQYCKDNAIRFRTDSSNLESEYTRNKIRNQILPLFQQINPSFNHTMEENIHRIKQVSDYFSNSVEKIKEEWVVEQENQLLISLRHIDEFVDKELVLFEILQPYGFNGSVVSEIIDCIDKEVSGRQFFSDKYRLIKDRHNLILVPMEEDYLQSVFHIDVDTKLVTEPLNLKIENDLDAAHYSIEKNNSVGQFDADLIQYPLTIRKWKQGDVFKPLGMRHFKKLSDYFIDNKFSLKDKEDVWLLVSGEDIIWIIGHRTDDRYKIGPKTSKVAKFTLL